MQDDGGRHDVANFRTDEAILTTFQQSTPGTNQYHALGSEMQSIPPHFVRHCVNTARPKSADDIRHKKSVEDAYLTSAIARRFSIQ